MLFLFFKISNFHRNFSISDLYEQTYTNPTTQNKQNWFTIFKSISIKSETKKLQMLEILHRSREFVSFP